MTDNPSPYVYSTPQIQRAKLDWQAVEELAPVTDDDTLHGAALDAAQADAYSAFGINFAGDIYEEWRWFGDGGYMELLGANRTEVVNLTGAGQYNEAVQRAVAIQHHYPHMKILWRHMISQPPGATDKTDKGMWRLPYTEFVDNLVINYGYRDHGWYVVTDCEGHIGGNELEDYARMEAERLDYGVPKGAKFAVLRMSTHHPSPAVLNSGVLDRLLESVRDHMGDFDNPNVVISNNGYFDDHHPDPAHWNLDGLQTAVNLMRRCQDTFKFTPRIIMGEYNYDRGLTSEHGPNAEHMAGDVLVGKLNGRYADKLRGVAQVLVYCCGIGQDKKVKNFHLDNETARKVVLSAPVFERPTMAVPDHWADEDGTMPIEDYREIVAALQNMGGALTLTVRSAKSTASTPKGSIRAGDTIGVQPAEAGQALDGGRGDQWVPVAVKVGSVWQTGYVHSHYLVVPAEPPVEEPPVDDEDTQPGPPMDDKAARQAAWKLLKEGHEARAVAQQAMREADDLIAQGWQALMLLEDLNNEEAA